MAEVLRRGVPYSLEPYLKKTLIDVVDEAVKEKKEGHYLEKLNTGDLWCYRAMMLYLEPKPFLGCL